MSRPPAKSGFARTLLPEAFAPTRDAVAAVCRDYEFLLREVMRFVLERFESNPAYGWCDTKYDILRGVDFAVDDPVRGPGTVYGWIQGRALEAMAGHAAHFAGQPDPEAAELATRVAATARIIAANLEKTRQRNGGRVSFFFTPEGESFVLNQTGARVKRPAVAQQPMGYADLFAAKGLLALAHLDANAAALERGRDYLHEAAGQIFAGQFRNDQQVLNPRNPSPATAASRAQGPFMILLGAAALWLGCGGGAEAVETGARALNLILDHHANLDGRHPALQAHDYWEYLDTDGEPLIDDGRILSDPGHALEFVGLAAGFAEAARASGRCGDAATGAIARFEKAATGLLLRNFANGFNSAAGGICKSFDLAARRPISAEMPWWSLPEAMRAALMAARITVTPEERRQCLEVYRACHNAFVKNYVRPDRHCLALQTRAADGSPVDAIPATPDADPGYHTGLCLIACLGELNRA